MAERMSCHGYPRPDTVAVHADGVTRATCLCRRQLALVQGVPGRQDHWRHKPKVKVLR